MVLHSQSVKILDQRFKVKSSFYLQSVENQLRWQGNIMISYIPAVIIHVTYTEQQMYKITLYTLIIIKVFFFIWPSTYHKLWKISQHNRHKIGPVSSIVFKPCQQNWLYWTQNPENCVNTVNSQIMIMILTFLSHIWCTAQHPFAELRERSAVIPH